MENKNFFYVVQDKYANGDMFAYATKIYNSQNLLAAFHDADAIAINACTTFKEAKSIADFWNECAKKNGNYGYGI